MTHHKFLPLARTRQRGVDKSRSPALTLQFPVLWLHHVERAGVSGLRASQREPRGLKPS